MKPDKFIDAMGHIDESLIDEYQKAGKMRRPTWVKITSIAASIAVVISATLLIWRHGGGIEPVDPPVTDITTEAPIEDPSDHVTHEDFKIVAVDAEKKDGNFISGDTSFVVTTEHGTADDVRTHLFISTAPEYSVEEIDDNTFQVMLADSISDNTVVSLSYVEDGIIDRSWAFQTEGKLTLSGSYPRDGATTAPVNSVIELEFSYSSAEGVEDAVTFEPELTGTWEHAGRIWRFTPDEDLAKDTTYKIYVGKGITAEGKEIEKTATVTFSTYEERAPYSCDPGIITVDGINSYLPDSDLTVRFTTGSTDGLDIGRVSVEQFASYSDMLAFNDGESVYESEHLFDANYTLEKTKGSNTSSYNMHLEETLPQGYYVARVYAEDGVQLFDWIMQVHPLSVYAAVTERDVLIWVAKDGELAEGIPVVFDDVEGVTGEDGTLLLKDSTNGYGEISYITVGDEDAPFIVGAPNFTHDNYPRAYIYSDKPKYKSTDTVKIWGMIPLELFYEEPDGEFTVMLGEEPDTEIVITPDENGVFECELEVVNHKDSEPNGTSLSLCYDGTVIAYRTIDIYDYYLDNYEIELSYDKKYYEQGENIEFEVKVTHVSGIDVSGKEIIAKASNQEFRAVTGTDGVAKFTITPDEYANIGGIYDLSLVYRSCSFDIDFAELADTQNNIYPTHIFYVLQTPVEAEATREDDAYTLDFKYTSIDKLNGIADADGAQVTDLAGNTFTCGAPYNTDVRMTFTLTRIEREFLEYEYDAFTNTRIPVYSDSRENIATEIENRHLTQESVNGTVRVDLSSYILPEATDTEKYSWTASISYTLPNGYTVYRDINISGNSFVEPTGNGNDYSHGMGGSATGSDDYLVYGYGLDKSVNHEYNEGEVIPFKLTAYNGSEIDGGKLMYFVYSQGVRQVIITDEHEFEITVGELTFPNARVAAAYFKDGVFHRVSANYISYNTEQRTLDIGITTDKEDYKPGDDVTVTIEVNTPEGILPGASVNISVVNEAVFTHGDSTGITTSLLSGAVTRDYLFSSYRDYSLPSISGGGMGGGPRFTEFGDTVYFGTAVTDEDGKCTVEFTLPEGRVTSYRITVHAVNSELYSGVNTENIEAASDFFVQPGEVKYTKITDDLVIPASLLTAVPDTAVMNFRLNELDLELNVTAETGKMSFANFGKIPAGDYTVTITTVSDTGDPELVHQITVPVSVKVNTLEITESHTVDITEELEFTPSSSPVTMNFFNAETERYGKYINYIRETDSERFDTVIANTYASTIREKIYGIPGSNELSSIYKYIVSGTGYYNLAMLEDGDPDALLTALYMYITGDRNTVNGHYGSDTKHTLSPEVEAAESLLIRAAAGEAVLVDLLYAAEDVSDDPYVRALLSLALSISGDTASAKELLIPMGEDATEGDRALYCAALVFVDRTAAGDEIDRLIAESPEEPYLGLAASIYMKTGEAQIGKADSVTVICGDEEHEVSIQGLTSETLVLSIEDGETIRFEDATEGMRTSYSYQATFTPKEDENNVRGLEVSITEDISVSHDGVIRIELGNISNDGKVKVALPSSLRYDSPYFGLSSNIVTAYANDNEQFIEIPVNAVSPGHYVLEPVIYTVDGVNYYSDTLEFTVGNGDCSTAIDPVVVTAEPSVTETEPVGTAETEATE